jgi:hypothetical protein
MSSNEDESNNTRADSLFSDRDGASGAATAAFDSEVVEEQQDLQQEVQEHMDSIIIDAMLVLNISLNEEENVNAREDSLSSDRDGASTAATAAAAAAIFDAEVVEERDLQQDVQARMDSNTIDAMFIVNISSNEEENNNARADSLSSDRDSASAAAAAAAAVFDAEVVEERDLQQEVQARMDSITIVMRCL